MRVVVVGASGNVGTSVLRSLAAEPTVDSVLGVARRPRLDFAKTERRHADVTASPLEPLLQGADAVVHLAWLIQPGRDKALLRAVNVEGSARVFLAAARAGVPNVLYASSVGAYARGPKDRRVDEGWPTTGIPTSFYPGTSPRSSACSIASKMSIRTHRRTAPPGTHLQARGGLEIRRCSRVHCCRVPWRGAS